MMLERVTSQPRQLWSTCFSKTSCLGPNVSQNGKNEIAGTTASPQALLSCARYSVPLLLDTVTATFTNLVPPSLIAALEEAIMPWHKCRLLWFLPFSLGICGFLASWCCFCCCKLTILPKLIYQASTDPHACTFSCFWSSTSFLSSMCPSMFWANARFLSQHAYRIVLSKL